MDRFTADDDFLPFPHYNLVSKPILYHHEPHYTDYELLQTINLTIEIRKLLTGAPSVLGNTSEEVRKFSVILQDACVDIHASKQDRNLTAKRELYDINHHCRMILAKVYDELSRHVKSESRPPVNPRKIVMPLELLSQSTKAIESLLRRINDNVPQSSTVTLQLTTGGTTQIRRHQDDHVGGQLEFTDQSTSTTPEEIDFSKMTDDQFVEWEKRNGVHELNKSDPISVEEASKILDRYEGLTD